MARIYYKEEKLTGKAIDHKVINVDLFDYIFNSTNTNKFQIETNSKLQLLKVLKVNKEVFKYVKITRDGINYNTDEGNFYLPNSIIFYDEEDAVFPSEFYFISKIGDEIELRKCVGGKDIKWFQIPVLHTSVIDKKIILKIKNSLKKVKKLVETTHNKKIEEERAQKELERKREIEENRPLLNKEQKEGYKTLVELCVHNNNKSKSEVILFTETLKNYDEDEEYFTTLNYFLEFLEKGAHNFIIRLDWKAAVEDLEWSLKSSLKDNYNEIIKLPKSESYGKEILISHKGVFEDYIKPLRLIGLQLGFIDTQSDEYILILHKQEDKEKIKEAFKIIGYAYSDEK